MYHVLRILSIIFCFLPPAGGIERNDGKEYRAGRGNEAAEDTLEAARRELSEETGYVASQWIHLISIPSNATMADNIAHVFLARGCEKVSGQVLDETEFLSMELHSAGEIEAAIKNGSFAQSVHVMAWLLARRALAKL